MVTQSFSNDSGIMRPDGSTRVYMQLASLLLAHTQRYQEAYQLTRKAVKVEEDWEETHNLMGRCLVKLERHSEAVAAFKKAVSDAIFLKGHSATAVYTILLGLHTALSNHFDDNVSIKIDHSLSGQCRIRVTHSYSGELNIELYLNRNVVIHII